MINKIPLRMIDCIKAVCDGHSHSIFYKSVCGSAASDSIFVRENPASSSTSFHQPLLPYPSLRETWNPLGKMQFSFCCFQFPQKNKDLGYPLFFRCDANSELVGVCKSSAWPLAAGDIWLYSFCITISKKD